MKTHLVLIVICVFTVTSANHFAQSGGAFQITQSVIAGGGADSSGPGFAVVGTAAQPATAESTGTAFSLRGGFWTASFAPTAAGVSIRGKIRTTNGAGIRNVRVTLTQIATGEARSALSSAFGYYRFDDVMVGQIYLLTVNSKQFTFEPNERIVTLLDEIADEDFVANPKLNAAEATDN